MKKKLNKRQQQAKNTYEKLYGIAVDQIERKGFQNITVEEICRKAGVSVGTFYNYFKSKNDILFDIFKIADDYFLNVVSKNLDEGNVYDKIVKFFSYYAEYNKARGLDFIKQLYNPYNTLFITKGRHMQIVLQNIIEDGKKSGEICTDMTSEEVVEYLFVAIRGVVYDWCIHDGSYDLNEYIIKYTRRLIKVLND